MIDERQAHRNKGAQGHVPIQYFEQLSSSKLVFVTAQYFESH